MVETDKHDGGLYMPAEVVLDNQLGSTQKIVYAAMIEGKGDDGICRMTAQELADRLNLTRSAVLMSRKRLCDSGYVRLISKTRRDYKIVNKRKERHD